MANWLRRLLTLLLFASVPSNALVFDIDDRLVADGDDSKFRAIGLVKSSIGYATGFLVDDCNVLTSRHVESEYGNVIGHTLAFRPTRPGARFIRGEVIASGEPPLKPLSRIPSADRHDDWLLFRLDKCVGSQDGFIALSGRPVSPGEPLMGAGFPADRSTSKLSIDPSCRIHLVLKIGALNDCAFLEGSSGGPLFYSRQTEDDTMLEAVAVGSAGYRYRESTRFTTGIANVATLLAPLLPRLRKFVHPKIRGSDIADVLHGTGLSDTIEGGSGDDTFYLDDDGGDSLWGGSGRDVFILLPSSGQFHRINDFAPDEGDRIDYTKIDADHTLAGLQMFEPMHFADGHARGVITRCAPSGDKLLELFVKHRGAATLKPDYTVIIGHCSLTA